MTTLELAIMLDENNEGIMSLFPNSKDVFCLNATCESCETEPTACPEFAKWWQEQLAKIDNICKMAEVKPYTELLKELNDLRTKTN